MSRWVIVVVLSSACASGVRIVPPDGGATDAGELDAGPIDSGTPDAGLPCFDDGGLDCGLPPHAPYCEIMKSPRAYPMVEYLVLEATGEFVADDQSYERAASDWAALSALSFAGRKPQVAAPFDLVAAYLLSFDDAGFELVRDGGYHDWDCLNDLYGASSGVFLHYPYGDANASNSYGYVTFDRRILRFRDLASDYATLPHVVGVTADSNGVIDDCGYNNDACLKIDGGVFTVIGNLESGQCDEVWYRSTSFPDGGREIDLTDAGYPVDWLKANPECLTRIRALRAFDAGF